MCTKLPESIGQRLSQELSGQERVHGRHSAGEKQPGFFVVLFPIALSARGTVLMASVTSSRLAFPELGSIRSTYNL